MATTLSQSRAMATKRKTRHYYSTHNVVSTVSFGVSERQRSRPCGQNLCVAFLRTVLPPEVGESARAMAATARQKHLYLRHQGEFQHNYFDFVSLHHSDHNGVVRIFVGHSEVVKRLLRGTIFPYQECNEYYSFSPQYIHVHTTKMELIEHTSMLF